MYLEIELWVSFVALQTKIVWKRDKRCITGFAFVLFYAWCHLRFVYFFLFIFRKTKPRTSQRNKSPFKIFVPEHLSHERSYSHTYVWGDSRRNATGLLNYYLITCDCRTWAGTVSRRTEAVVTRFLVLADRISTTRILQSRAFVDV